MKELERWFALQITDIYHETVHRALVRVQTGVATWWKQRDTAVGLLQSLTSAANRQQKAGTPAPRR
ncbi:MAG TPA: hypothetical protein VMI06_12870 [Terriglobia bacterium]|nr:hypothetical protein [Terriglobia bacterium]